MQNLKSPSWEWRPRQDSEERSAIDGKHFYKNAGFMFFNSKDEEGAKK